MSVQVRPYWRLLVTYLKPQWGRVVLLAVLLFASIGLQLINPQVIRAFIYATQAGSQLSTLLLSPGIFIGLSVSQRISAVFSAFVATNTACIATNPLPENMTMNCLQLWLLF